MKENIEKEIFITLGEVSMCWSEKPKGIFESEKAKEIGERLIKLIKENETTKLGLATTSELIYELAARCDTGSIDKGGKYKPIDGNF